MMQQPNGGNEKLRFNKATDCYEATIVIKVEAEIFQRAFFRHVEENHVDITDPEALQRAIDDVSRVVKWLEHPRTQKVIAPTTGPLMSMPKTTPEPIHAPTVQYTGNSKNLSQAEEATLREKALALPVDEWESLLSPLPPQWNGATKRDKNNLYRRRYSEKQVFARLRKELETPLDMVKVEAIAGAVNGVRFN